MQARSLRLLPIVLILVTAALAAGSAGAAQSLSKNVASAQAFAVKILVPGQAAIGTMEAVSPPDAVALGQSYAYPDDGSVVSTGPTAASASTSAGGWRARATSTSEVNALQLFGGEIGVTKVTVRASAFAGPKTSSGTLGAPPGLAFSVLGQSVTAATNLRIALADWGYAIALEQGVDPSAPSGRKAYRASITALDVHLTAAHGGLPAGSEILVGYAESYGEANAARQTHPVHRPKQQKPRRQHPRTHPQAKAPKRRTPKPPEPTISPFGPPPVKAPPKTGHPKLTGGGYVFPVYGPSSFTDTFGAPRADTGWHHGDDIFAPLGAPVVAVATGTIFSVGWNDLGGNRLWLADRKGNQFYYAHLFAFAPLAVNGARVRAGDVLGFVGNTGDAAGTPYHLHFEIHPASMLGMGYDGVVDPTRYLTAWQHLRDLPFPSTGLTSYPNTTVARRTAPEPGAIVIGFADISQASSLSPSSIRRALTAAGLAGITEGDTTLVGTPRVAKR